MVDAFCSKTVEWYESRVLAMKTSPQGEPLIKVHFMGWNQKYDEWILRDGPSIAALGSSKWLIEESKQAILQLVPWYQTDLLTERAIAKLGPFPNLKKCNVRLEGIEDWCIDYSYANPSLWLIAESGAWYRIASCLSPGGIAGHPNKLYVPAFKEISLKFVIPYSIFHFFIFIIICIYI
jgi:hypothetical protein